MVSFLGGTLAGLGSTHASRRYLMKAVRNLLRLLSSGSALGNGIRVAHCKPAIASLLVLALFSGSPVHALFGFGHKKKPASSSDPLLTPDQLTLLRRAAFRERFLIQVIQQHTPLIQTYIQRMRPDRELGAVPSSDEYLLGRVDFAGRFNEVLYKRPFATTGTLGIPTNLIDKLTGLFRLKMAPNGYMDMMFVDFRSFDFRHYHFRFIRREFLGSVRTSVFDVTPRLGSGRGRFVGRIWIEDQDANIVRYTGTFSNPGLHQVYFHFDSWRGNVQPSIWLPMAIYVEDRDFRAQSHIWGYGFRLPSAIVADNQTDAIERTEQADASSQDMSPLEAQRDWESQNERNVLDRLTQAGLLANPSDFDKVLQTVTNNLILGSNLALPGDVHCRVLLTSTLESLAVGNTIILSKGLIDVLPNEEDLAAMLSFQLAHIALRHSIDTRYAFSDRLYFPDEHTLQQILLSHTDVQNQEAAAKAVDIFHASIYANKAGSVGLFLAQLLQTERHVPALLSPRLGDPLTSPSGAPWLAAFEQQAPPLQIDDLQQIAALPLNSHLRIDPWTDEVFSLNFSPAPLLSARDKMPFQITPIYYRLQRYKAPEAGGPSSAAVAQH
jgi:hypothetical protein